MCVEMIVAQDENKSSVVLKMTSASRSLVCARAREGERERDAQNIS